MADSPENELLEALGRTFMEAMAARRAGDVDRALDLLRQVVRGEPRLPEPHFELAHIHLTAGRLPEAEIEARTALRWLEQGGQWVDDVPEHVMLSMANNLLGEVLRQRADADEIVFGDPEVFEALLKESKAYFAVAAQLDPTSEHSEHHDFFLGLDELAEGLEPGED